MKQNFNGYSHTRERRSKTIKYSDDMGNIYENIDEYNSNKKRKVLIVLDNTVADMLRNKILQLIAIYKR